MSEESIDWVCLNCYNRWQPSNIPQGGPQCSKRGCKSRLTVSLPTLRKHIGQVQETRDRFPFPVGELGKLPKPHENIPGFVGSARAMIEEANPHAAEGLSLLNSVAHIVDERNDNEELESVVDRLHKQVTE